MLFNSVEFLIFFPVVVVIYFATPHKYRWVLLLIASYYFYMSWKAEYLILIIISTLVDYFLAIQIGKTYNKLNRKILLVLSLTSNLGLLFAFKYFNFLNDSIRHIFNLFSLSYQVPGFDLLLPVGISFYTFQTLSYTIDVYRGKKEPEKHLGIFAVYVSFFPQLVAGPIERATNLIPQFHKKLDFDYERVTDGLKLMAWGFFKKLVIADRLAIMVNTVYNNPTQYEGIHFIVTTIFFAFQIYCDFSGYSDIAIGGAKVMGYKLMNNFDRPYSSKSIFEFWKRWHISLSTWFRDYLYIALGGNRVIKWRWYYNLFIVFLISGLWHGASWTFVIWGALNGFYLVFAIFTKEIRIKFVRLISLDRFPKLYKYIQLSITFTLICFAWIFFRANNISDAFYIISHLFDGVGDFLLSFLASLLSFNFSSIVKVGSQMNVLAYEFVIVILSIGFMEFIQLKHDRIRFILARKPLIYRWIAYYFMVMSILLFGVFKESGFIYFQF
jgi:D-alanyl-lipoteichoic acid acyltransferase DltB (MBOAT superfamily)